MNSKMIQKNQKYIISRRRFIGLTATTAGMFPIIPSYAGKQDYMNKTGINKTGKETIPLIQGSNDQPLKRKQTGSYPGHFKGRFIWDDKIYPLGKPLYRMFRAVIDLPEKEIKDAVLRITAADKFTFYINGQHIGSGPCRSLTPQWMFYDELDVKEYLMSGKNVIAAMVFWHGTSNGFSANQRSGFFFECDVLYKDGTIATSVSDTSVKTLECRGWNPNTPNVNGFQGILIEDYDAEADPSDWYQTDFDDSAWADSYILSVKNTWGRPEYNSCWEYLEPRLTPMLNELPVPPDIVVQTGRTKPPSDIHRESYAVAKRIEFSTFKPTSSPEYNLDTIQSGKIKFSSNDEGDPYFILDFTEPRNAVPYISVEAPKDIRIEFAWSYDLEVIGKNIIGRFVATYKTRDGLQEWHPWHVTNAFRYLMVIFRTGGKTVTLKDVKIISHEYPVIQTGSFICSDPVLTKLWQTCTRTTYLHLQDTYIMDPSRERAFYTVCGEMEQCHLNYYIAYGDIAATKTHFKLMTHFQLIDGKFPTLLIPKERWGFPELNIPITSPNNSTIPIYCVFYAEAVRRRQKHFPNPSFYREQYPNLLLLANFLERNTDENNLLYNLSPINWLDWPLHNKWQVKGYTGAILGYNAAYVGFCAAMSEITAAMGYVQDSNYWQEKKQAIKESIEKRFWDEKMGLFRDFYNDENQWEIYSELFNCYAIIYDIGTKEQHRRIIDVIKRKPENVTLASPLYYYYVMEAFYKAGESDFITKDCSIRYKSVVDGHDFPTLPEEWPDSETITGAASVHGGGSGVAYAFTAHIAGVTPMTDGFETISFAPKPGNLTHASAAIPTPLGLTSIRWEKTGTALEVHIKVPKGAKGVFTAPEGYKAPKRRIFPEGNHSFVCKVNT